jgi:aerotaxis receptor
LADISRSGAKTLDASVLGAQGLSPADRGML